MVAIPSRIKIVLLLLNLISLVLCAASCSESDRLDGASVSDQSASFPAANVFRILYVDSYNTDYAWVREVSKGINAVLDERIPDPSSYELRVMHMDTKNHRKTKEIEAAALLVKSEIDAWEPDVVICSDDNAVEYVIVKYYLNTDVPVIFCGVNWDCSHYGLPASNVTGILEVYLVPQLLEILEPYCKGMDIGFIASDTPLEARNAVNVAQYFNLDMNVRLASSLEDFKQAYVDLQEQCDVLLMYEIQSIEGYDEQNVCSFIMQNTRIPTGSPLGFLAPYVLVACATSGEEHGRWAASKAVDVLEGTPVSSIPVEQNKNAIIYLNMSLAKRLNIVFPMKLINRAIFVEELP